MKLTFTLIALCSYCLLHAQKAGTLDRSFGDTGIVIGSTYSGECRNLLVQPDGKIIATGVGSYNNIGGFLVVRYNKDGSTDLSFGDSGRVATTLSPKGSNGGYSALQPDGKIVVTGIVVISGVLGQSVALIRYNTDGSLDSSFGNNGSIINDLGSEYEDPSGVLIQPDGKIVITGSLHNYDEGSGPDTIYILRYNTDGSLDAGFAKNGVYKEAALDLNPIETAGAALQPDGKILLGGDRKFSDDFFVRRYTQNGRPDSAFGVDGEANYEFSDVIGSYISSIYLQADGKIVAGGASYSSSERSNVTLVRFNADGSVDNSFGTLGLVTTEIAGYSSEIKDITEQTNHKILIAGNKFDSSTKDSTKFTLIRYLENGAIDSSFGTSGITIIDLGFNEQASSIALQNDNKIIVGGYLFKPAPPYYFVTLARYNNDATKKQIIIQKIKHYIQTHNDAQATTLNNVSIYPNPVQNILHVEGLSVNAKITVVDFNGNVIVSRELSPVPSNTGVVSNRYDLNVASLHAGNYLLKIETNGEVVTKQFVKE